MHKSALAWFVILHSLFAQMLVILAMSDMLSGHQTVDNSVASAPTTDCGDAVL